ncbi:MAG: hypothetical protein ACNYZH_10695, partial [Acidimicrobiia bacterium]
MIHPAFEIDRHIERLNGQRLEQRLFKSEVFPHSDAATVDRGTPRNDTCIIANVGFADEGVQFVERLDPWDGDEMAPTEPADLALNAALLMCPVDTGET